MYFYILIILKVNNTKTRLNVVFYSLLSGLLACLVSILIKLAFNLNNFFSINIDGNNWSRDYLNDQYLKYALLAFIIAIGLLVNSLMWIFYSKSLALSTSTIYSTGLNKFSNFVFSALSGYFIFNEQIDLIKWLVGIGLLLIGLVILADQQTAKQQPTPVDEKQKQKQK